MDPLRQSPEIRDTLHFVIRQFYVEVLLQASEQTERLQAVDAKFFEEVIIRRQALPRDFELRGGQFQNFIQVCCCVCTVISSGVPFNPAYGR